MVYINEKKCNNFPFHYFPFPVHSYFTTKYAYAYSTQLSTVFQLCAFQAGIRMYIRITIPGVWNGKLLFHSTLNIPGQSGFPVVCGIRNGKFAFHSILPVWNSRGLLHFFSLIPYIAEYSSLSRCIYYYTCICYTVNGISLIHTLKSLIVLEQVLLTYVTPNMVYY